MKTMMTLAALLLGSTAAFAGEPINDPRAEVFRAAGCDAEWLRPVTNAAGEVLYWTNTNGKGCGAASGDPSDNAQLLAIARVVLESLDSDEEDTPSK